MRSVGASLRRWAVKICIDPGHGMGNRTAGVYDPGACHEENGRKYEEADIVLDYARELAVALAALGHETMLTRGDRKAACPIGQRARKAELWKADALVSVHVNDADSDEANGVETLWRNPGSLELARAVQRALVAATGFKDRGVKIRQDLTVLSFDGPAILIELGFIAHDGNRAVLLDAGMRVKVCAAVAEAVVAALTKGRK